MQLLWQIEFLSYFTVGEFNENSNANIISHSNISFSAPLNPDITVSGIFLRYVGPKFHYSLWFSFNIIDGSELLLGREKNLAVVLVFSLHKIRSCVWEIMILVQTRWTKQHLHRAYTTYDLLAVLIENLFCSINTNIYLVMNRNNVVTSWIFMKYTLKFRFLSVHKAQRHFFL